MGEAIGATLGFAMGIAVSPVPVAAVILMLFSGRARSNSVGFAIAWVVGIATVLVVTFLIPGLGADQGSPSQTTGYVKLALGVALALLAVRVWRRRPGPGEEPHTPGWMARIDDMRIGAALGMGFALSALNPKNLALAVAAGATMQSVGATGSALYGAAAVFTLLAGLTVLLPVIVFLIAGDRMAGPLQAAKDWLLGNNSTVMAVLLIVFSASLVGDGIQILSS